MESERKMDNDTLTELRREIAYLRGQLDDEFSAVCVDVGRAGEIQREIQRLERHVQSIRNEANEHREVANG